MDVRTLLRTTLGLCAFICLSVVAEQPASRDTARELKILAESGNAEAMYHLGMLYNNGIGVEHSPKTALSYFRQSAKGGDPLGHYKLGCYQAGQFGPIEGLELDQEKAFANKLAAAEAGYALAQYDVAGYLYKNEDIEASFKWLKRAAAQGNAQALGTLARLYLNKQEAYGDAVQAFKYLQLLARKFPEQEELAAQVERVAASLTPAQREEVEKQLENWQFQPSELTQQAVNGLARTHELLDAANDGGQ